MSRITLSGNASGTGNFTLASPNSSTDRTLTLPDATGTVLSAPAGAVTINSSAPSDALTLDGSGNLLVGKAATGYNTSVGTELWSNGFSAFTRNDAIVSYFNRKTSDGDVVQFQKDGTTVGSIGSMYGAYLYIGSTGGQDTFIGLWNGSVRPTTSSGQNSDNTTDIGDSGARWNDVYATNGTIQTSDRNEKQDIRDITEAETRVAQACKGLLKAYRWKDAVAEKGEEARIHFGIIAQDLQAAFESEGLDAGRYAMFIHSTWTDEETGEERSRMGVRYSELLAFIIGAL